MNQEIITTKVFTFLKTQELISEELIAFATTFVDLEFNYSPDNFEETAEKTHALLSKELRAFKVAKLESNASQVNRSRMVSRFVTLNKQATVERFSAKPDIAPDDWAKVTIYGTRTMSDRDHKVSNKNYQVLTFLILEENQRGKRELKVFNTRFGPF